MPSPGQLQGVASLTRGNRGLDDPLVLLHVIGSGVGSVAIPARQHGHSPWQ
jgi:hypothetical protein